MAPEAPEQENTFENQHVEGERSTSNEMPSDFMKHVGPFAFRGISVDMTITHEHRKVYTWWDRFKTWLMIASGSFVSGTLLYLVTHHPKFTPISEWILANFL